MSPQPLSSCAPQ
jgi:hypothetical protein